MRSFFTLLLVTLSSAAVFAQDACIDGRSMMQQPVATAYDSLIASKIPLVTLPASYRSKVLPPVVDNSQLPYFPSIYDQYTYFSCQQYAGVAYTYTYELNRLQNASANTAEHRFPPHYTWNFLNYGGRYVGVNFLHTFHAMMQQGHMRRWEYGVDTAQGWLGWITGYGNYEKGFPNRLKGIRSINTRTEEGILTLKHYLYDHLDGSSTGGVVCFTAAGPTYIFQLPQGTPEEGKHVVTTWPSWATHGMTLVGYNDSIRYDINNDGQYTNDTDITGDGIVDPQDWEIGAFKMANSFGTWWSDGGYCYVMYEAMARHFEYGGVWNHCVYIVDPDTSYKPLLGMEFTLKYNQRSQIRITAGVNADTAAKFPAHTMEFPYFNYQGGPYPMQGRDTIAGQDEIELGLDVTPLLAYADPGQPAKYFFIVEEADPFHLASGLVRNVTFHNYTGTGSVFSSPEADVPIIDQGTTFVSATGTVDFSPLQITTESLPPATAGQPLSTQLSATGGTEPYKWRLLEQYHRSPVDSGYSGISGTYYTEFSDEIPYAEIPLPFPFPFFGKKYDTIYMNGYGMLQFNRDHLPYPYLVNTNDMLRNIPVIFPAFNGNHRIVLSDNDGMWVKTETEKVTFRWRLSVYGSESVTQENFEMAVFPDGSFEFYYGDCVNDGTSDRIVYGYSKGDDINYEINACDNLTTMTGLSIRYTPPISPDGISVSEDGLLTWESPGSDNIYDISVRVTDERLFNAEKTFQLSAGLFLQTLLDGYTGNIHFGEPVPVEIIATNTGSATLPELNLVLRCSDTLVSITDSTETIQDLGPNQAGTIPNAFNFYLLHSYEDATCLFFTIDATAGTNHWTYTFPVKVSAPEIRMTSCNLRDGANSLLDPGEVADLVAELGNFGSWQADSVVVTATTTDTLVSILSGEISEYGQMLPNTAIPVILRLKASRFIQPGSVSHLVLTFQAAGGIEKQYAIDLQLGSKPVAIVSLTTYTSSVQAMKASLDSLGCAYDHYTWLGPQLMTYPVTFLILGTAQGSHFLSDDEGSFFANYLRNGGNLYMETYADWAHNTNALTPMLHFTSEKVPVYQYLELNGATGSFLEGMDFPYTGAAYYSIYDLLPTAPAFSILENNETPPHVLQYAFDDDGYKVIGSMVEYGKIADSAFPSTKTNLMEKYLDFYGVIFKGPYPFFHADSTTVCRFHPVQFTDDSYDNVNSWHWDLPGGQPASSDLQNPTVVYPTEGTYDVTLTVSDGIVSHTLTRKEFIRVEICAGVDEPPAVSSMIVYPNPAKDNISILFPGGTSSAGNAMLMSATGIVVKTQHVAVLPAGSSVTIGTNDIPDGLYILRVICQGEAATRKIIIRK